ncbi:ATP synthase F1 subunit gamma [Candidatus Nomurabacteria bacterium RIFCSPHIGHO2_01_FULL_39_220]|uniref:ATP synthase gamma chain n=1 Tax=Candidatus Nomurabacteria bacterium RIFCSPLOWO2_02_FULL_40_67 TaxID=1801787 RepID=A0A1F6Y667_9BACT|nr:MAG: ATP synthase gamma chain [Parcubacteria group bacterium GW2011_GWA2_40_37]KKS11868.1 MAG: ATP synthase gamma chain [Parcubacteria group bacterium GW2011_GWB1_41_5]KKS71979.1 MAG: ATP synthase gamma chain [Parcubacteria group bacterium GW2011_GWF2_42_7]OGI61600.1 MAG: ATP synthase F1 subunit gamma [Candidatus Nomurabacteria bacterium RBG_16_40_11]OGI70365.1 MAG: ATP synthase F1 subunit gamma [Candidatus Nomurabacteria bacterium RIFCSPHIGHO2_01_FULL_39_220]OGI72505.1 MAG: ATP synthase F1
MAGTKEIKRRIKSVKNTKKITKAMELVAASKMKRAVASTLASRLYAEYSWEILTSIARSLDGVEELNHPLFNEREKNTGKILLILITSNRGLCGAYNAQVIKQAILLLKKQPASAAGKNLNIEVITIGRKGDVAMHRLGVNVVASFTELSDHISLSEIIPISKLAIDEYSALKYDKVLVAYTDFISALTQRANIKQIIPVTKADLKELIEEKSAEVRLQQNQKINYLIEGDMNTLILSLAEKITRMQIYQMLLESNASEQSSRMVAMKNASDASGEMIDDLTLVFNKARQSNITREISEISAGMASVS